MQALFFLLAALLALQSLIAWQDGPRFLGFVRRRLSQPVPDDVSPTTLICPCKGVDPELGENLRALLDQDHPDYEVLLVVAEPSDPARGVCEQVARESSVPVRLIVAGTSAQRGEKVTNLLAGVAAARPESQVFVFADSDGRPPRPWLRTLVAHLALPARSPGEPEIGAASTFRWYIPDGDFLSGLQSAWNAPAVTYMGEWKRNFCWGGGTAIRRQTFEEIDAARYWAGCVSDDYMLTRALREAGKRIVFVPQCLVATHHPTSWRRLAEWTTRQIIITRVYEPRLWWPALGIHLFYCATFLFGLILAAVEGPRSPMTSVAILLTLAAIASLAVAKGAYRLISALLLLPEHRSPLLRCWWSPTLQEALVPWLMAFNLIASGLTRHIVWRGITYELRSPWETRVIART